MKRMEVLPGPRNWLAAHAAWVLYRLSDALWVVMSRLGDVRTSVHDLADKLYETDWDF